MKTDVRQSKRYIRNGASLIAQQVKINLQCRRHVVRMGRSPGGGITFKYSCLKKSYGQRSLTRPLCTESPKVRHYWKYY